VLDLSPFFSTDAVAVTGELAGTEVGAEVDAGVALDTGAAFSGAGDTGAAATGAGDTGIFFSTDAVAVTGELAGAEVGAEVDAGVALDTGAAFSGAGDTGAAATGAASFLSALSCVDSAVAIAGAASIVILAFSSANLAAINLFLFSNSFPLTHTAAAVAISS